MESVKSAGTTRKNKLAASDDLETIQKIKAGDPQAYGDLIRRHQARLIRLCTSLLKNQTEAEDAAQEVFVKAYHALREFRQDATFSTWLYRIASNHCLSLLRARRPTESLDHLLETQGDGIERFLSMQKDARHALQAADFAEQLLSRLPENYRLVLTLREAEGLSYQEIAEVMGVTLDSVKALLRRARQEIEEKLRHFLKKESV